MRAAPLTIVASLSMIACSSETRSAPEDLVRKLGFSELAVVAPLAPEGFVDFYMGEQVLREFDQTGAYAPSDAKPYSMIRVPAEVVSAAQQSAEPVRLSLCEQASGVTLVSHVIGEDLQPLPDDVENCTPWVQYGRGTMTIQYQSGAPGVYGAAQVGLRDNGALFAGAAMEGALPSACENERTVSSSMFLGSNRPALTDDCRKPNDEEPGP